MNKLREHIHKTAGVSMGVGRTPSAQKSSSGAIKINPNGQGVNLSISPMPKSPNTTKPTTTPKPKGPKGPKSLSTNPNELPKFKPEPMYPKPGATKLTPSQVRFKMNFKNPWMPKTAAVSNLLKRTADFYKEKHNKQKPSASFFSNHPQLSKGQSRAVSALKALNNAYSAVKPKGKAV